MLLLAGLLGMVALGASALVGVSDVNVAETDDLPDESEEERSEIDAEGGLLSYVGPEGEVSAETDEARNDADAEHFADVSAEAAGPQLVTVPFPATAELSPAAELAELSVAEDEVVTVGTSGDDLLEGADARDVANGYAGDDMLTGGTEADQLWGGLGADTLIGGADADILNGDGGDDSIAGDEGNDLLYGHGDADRLTGGAGADSLVGGAGDDMLQGEDGDDILHGGLGDDDLRGGAGHDALFGGWGDDTLSGYEADPDAGGGSDTDGMDFLNGGGGSDVITAGAGDIVTTGDGADTVVLGEWLSGAHQAEILDFAPDEDTLMVIYDDADDSAPEVDLAEDPDDSGIMHVMLNGVAIATVNNAAGLNAGHITIIGSSLLEAQLRV
ncbi:calcium-binding protein [Roseovarius sp. S4756]|uniref:calcium-binding protein n=1 Tax=Roseovarius maritimus TaxID=3342637 RepID=UPI0037270CA9